MSAHKMRAALEQLVGMARMADARIDVERDEARREGRSTYHGAAFHAGLKRAIARATAILAETEN